MIGQTAPVASRSSQSPALAADGPSRVGMSAGRVVFDGAPETLTDDLARQLYGLESADVLGEGGQTLEDAPGGQMLAASAA